MKNSELQPKIIWKVESAINPYCSDETRQCRGHFESYEMARQMYETIKIEAYEYFITRLQYGIINSEETLIEELEMPRNNCQYTIHNNSGRIYYQVYIIDIAIIPALLPYDEIRRTY